MDDMGIVNAKLGKYNYFFSVSSVTCWQSLESMTTFFLFLL